MVKLRISGKRESTNIFNKLVWQWELQKGVKNSSGDKEYLNADGTIRRYFDLDFSGSHGNFEKIEEKFELSARISGSEQDVSVMLDILKEIASVFYVPTTGGDMRMKKREKDNYTVMVSFRDTQSVAKEKLLFAKTNPDLKMLR